MKRTTIIAFFLVLLSLAGCSSDETLTTQQPEFGHSLGQNPRYVDNKTEIDNGVEILRDAFGQIRRISFGNAQQAPLTAEDLFHQYMEVEPEGNLCLYRKSSDRGSSPTTLEYYQQVYKGIVVFDNDYSVRFSNGRVTGANGSFLQIDDLDVSPDFGVDKAKEYYANYLNVSVEMIDVMHTPYYTEALSIAELPVSRDSDLWAPRLVYALSYREPSSEGYCMIDAHSGCILLTWANYTAN